MDFEAIATREEVFHEVMSDTDDDMDARAPFIPENECYQLVSVSKGIIID